jgi:hypothetical protein
VHRTRDETHLAVTALGAFDAHRASTPLRPWLAAQTDALRAQLDVDEVEAATHRARRMTIAELVEVLIKRPGTTIS